MSAPRTGKAILAAVVAVVFTAAWPAAAAAVPFKPIVTSCASASGDAGTCSTVTPGSGLWELEVSPDGKHAYGSAWNDSALVIFDRNAATGTLTQTGCHNVSGSGCTAAKGLFTPDGIELSPDGEFLYVASWNGGVAAFDRNPTNGSLTQLPGIDGCVTSDGSFNGNPNVCIDGRGLGTSTDLVVSPDGKHLYVGGSESIVAFELEPDGSLDQPAGAAGCINNDGGDGCFDGQALGFARQITIAPDGQHVYAPTSDFRGVVVLARNATTGGLTQDGDAGDCITFNGGSSAGGSCGTEARIRNNVLVAQASSDGKQVYLMHNEGIVVFAREQNGTLAFQSCVNDSGSDGCANGRNVTNLAYAAPTPDGGHLIVNALGGGNGVSILRRDAGGNLTSVAGQDGCISASGNVVDGGAPQPNGCVTHPAADTHGHVTVLNDERFYVASYSGSAVMNVRADYYPTCNNRSATAPYNTSISIDLSCSDRNGDTVTLAVAQPPVAGNLGAIDAANSRVFYNPFSGYVGPDSFSYTGTSNGLTSDPATVNITVQPPVTPPGATDLDGDGSPAGQDCNDTNPGIRPGAIDIPNNGVDEDCAGGDARARVENTVAAFWRFFKKFTRVQSITVKGAPAGSTITVTCKGKGCRFKRKTIRQTKAGNRSLTKLFNFKKGKRRIVSKLRPKTVVEIRVTKPQFIGKVNRYKIRKGKAPSSTPLCLPVGSSTPVKTC